MIFLFNHISNNSKNHKLIYHKFKTKTVKIDSKHYCDDWGFPVIFNNDDKIQLICNDGLFTLKDNFFVNNKINITANTKALWGKVYNDDDSVIITSVNGKFYKIPYDCHYYETIFHDLEKNCKIVNNNVNEKFKMSNLKKSNNDFYYLGKNNYKYSFTNNEWTIISKQDLPKKFQDKFQFDESFLNIFGKHVNINDYQKSKPSLFGIRHSTKNAINKTKLGHLPTFDHLNIFDHDVTYKKCMEVFESKNLVNFKPKFHLSDMYDLNSHTFDTIHTVPVNDTYPCFLYNVYHKKYVFYTRANITYGTRYIQYSMSNDLKNWSEMELIDVTDPLTKKDFEFEEKQSYYTPSFYSIDNYIIGLLPLCDDKNKSIDFQFVLSTDMKLFKKIHSFDQFKMNDFNILDKNDINHNKNNMIFIPNTIHEFTEPVNENFNREYMGFFAFPHCKGKKEIKEYYVEKNRFIGVTGEFETEVFNVINNQLRVNCNGDFNISIYDCSVDKSTGKIQETFIMTLFLNGNYYDELIVPNVILKKVKLKIKVNAGEFYTISGLPINQVDQKVYNKLKYYYFEHTNRLDMNTVLRGKNKNKWKVIDLEYDVVKLGKTLYEEKMTVVKQELILPSGEIKTITLEDRRHKNYVSKIKKYIKNKYDNGNSCLCLGIKLI